MEVVTVLLSGDLKVVILGVGDVFVLCLAVGWLLTSYIS